MASVEIMLSTSVPGNASDNVEYVPPAGKTVKVRLFCAGGEVASLASIRLYWKYGAEDETMIWASAPGNQMPFVYAVPPAEIDGINKLAVVLENRNEGALFMAGYALIEVDD